MYVIEVIVYEVVSCVFIYENIKVVCWYVFISGIGNVESGFYIICLIFILNRIIVELKDKIKEFIIKYLGSEIFFEMKKCIKVKLESKF